MVNLAQTDFRACRLAPWLKAHAVVAEDLGGSDPGSKGTWCPLLASHMHACMCTHTIAKHESFLKGMRLSHKPRILAGGGSGSVGS